MFSVPGFYWVIYPSLIETLKIWENPFSFGYIIVGGLQPFTSTILNLSNKNFILQL